MRGSQRRNVCKQIWAEGILRTRVPKVRTRAHLEFAGPTAHGVLGSALQSLILYSLNFFDNGRRPGATTSGRITGDDYPEGRFRHLAPQGSIFIDFLTTQNGIEKTIVFRILKNQPKWQNQSTLERPRCVFGAKTSTFGLPFGIDFSTFSRNCKNAFGAYSFTDSMVFDHQKHLIFQ